MYLITEIVLMWVTFSRRCNSTTSVRGIISSYSKALEAVVTFNVV